MLSFVSLSLVSFAFAQQYYTLQDSFLGGPTFLDNFDFWTSWDPTFGYVHYVDQAAAEQFGMINYTDTTVSFGVETTQILDPNANLGRLSLRLTTIQHWTHGLFVLDLIHMPQAICGSWPSFWSLGGTGVWPSSGEIDIIEYVNDASSNLMSLHTLPGCTIAGADETGTLLTADCGLGNGITGCTVQSTVPSSIGSSFNDNGGGVYAIEWTSTAIRIWFFPRNAIPPSITSSSPNTADFGTPAANFEGSCDIDTFFSNHSLTFNIDFCGGWAGPTFSADGCPSLDSTNSWASCNEYVALNPGAFIDTYWEVNYLQVYQLVSGTQPSSSSSLSSVTPAVETSSVSTILSNAVGRSTTPTMSLAASTPVITTGSFTATSSALSVLASISASSVAANTVDASGSASSGVLTSSTATSATLSTMASADASLSSPSQLTTADTTPSISCSGNVCYAFTTAVVVQTVTIVAAAGEVVLS